MADQTPWPYMTCKQAAKRLRVPTETVQRLADGGSIQNMRQQGRTGEVVYLLRTSAVEALAQKMGY